MTDLNKPVSRKSWSSYRGRRLVVSLHPTHIAMRRLGTRASYVLDYQAAYECAVKLQVRADRAVKLAVKVAKKKAGKAK